jgi:uncharacterized integral membrane protein
MMPALGFWARRLCLLALLAAGALFALDNPHVVSVSLLETTLDVPLYWLVFVAVAVGFFPGFLIGWFGRHTPRNPSLNALPE